MTHSDEDERAILDKVNVLFKVLGAVAEQAGVGPESMGATNDAIALFVALGTALGWLADQCPVEMVRPLMQKHISDLIAIALRRDMVETIEELRARSDTIH